MLFAKCCMGVDRDATAATSVATANIPAAAAAIVIAARLLSWTRRQDKTTDRERAMEILQFYKTGGSHRLQLTDKTTFKQTDKQVKTCRRAFISHTPSLPHTKNHSSHRA